MNIKSFIRNKILFLVLLFLGASFTYGQSFRSLINDGVDKYEKGNFNDAEVNFRKGMEKDIESYKAHFNMGDALYKQERYDEAAKSFMNALSLIDDDLVKSKAFHNIGNSLLKSQKLDESIEAYKNALKLNPNDLETKYNLSYALKMKQQQEQQEQQQDQNKDQNQDQNQDQKDKQDQKEQENKDQQQQQQNKDKEKQDQQKDQQQQQQPQKKDEISKEEAKRILEALKNNEADLQKKLRKKKGKSVKKEKDW